MMDETLVNRFAAYFRHSKLDQDILSLGDDDVACKNARRALEKLGYARKNPDSAPSVFDKSLFVAVRDFQRAIDHSKCDGAIGPGTRQALATKLLEQKGIKAFSEGGLTNPKPTVFLSYAWEDGPRVEKFDQWLRDHDVVVIRDRTSFGAGEKVSEKIWEAVRRADRVVAVYSKNSKGRDWPIRERQIAEQFEDQFGTRILIYLCIDDVKLPDYDQGRIAIVSHGKPMKEAGWKILSALGLGQEQARVEYDEDEPI